MQLHAETIARVEAIDLSQGGDDRLVSLAIGDDVSGVRIIGRAATSTS